MLHRLLDLLGRSALSLTALLLSRKAKLRAAVWCMRWITKHSGNQPVCLQYNSDIGGLCLKVTDKYTQLTWELPPEEGVVLTGKCGESTVDEAARKD